MKSKDPPRIVFITGGNKGIGLETARQLAKAGWQVVIGCRRLDAGKEAVKTLGKDGLKGLSVQIDIADSAGIGRAAAEFGKHFEHLDVLINNAGIYPDEGLNILTISREQLAATFQTNTFGAVVVTQAFLPYLRRAGAARVINLSSGYGQLDGLRPEVPSYCLSKLALNGVTLMLSRALAGEGISVNSMSPGWVRTDMGGSSAPRSVEEGADTAVWLASQAPQRTTGKFFEDRKEIPW